MDENGRAPRKKLKSVLLARVRFSSVLVHFLSISVRYSYGPLSVDEKI